MTEPVHIYTDHAARFRALAQVPFEDLTMGDLKELHDMAQAKDLIHVDDLAAMAQEAEE